MQVIAIGVAAALRSGETREIVTYIKGDPLIVTIPTLPDEIPTKPLDPSTFNIDKIANSYADKNAVAKATDAAANSTAAENITPLAPAATHQAQNALPPITNPKVEALVEEASSAHINGDLIAALLKLEDAESIDKNEPAIYYRKALLFEDMSHWEKAADNYEKLFNMGSNIGIYYHRAALKLSQGINPESQNQGLLMLGNIATRTSPEKLQAKLIIPVRSMPDREFDPDLIEIRVHYYDIVDDKRIEPVPSSRQDNISNRWLTLPADWNDGGEEIIESTYTLPPIQAADAHIFGHRKYFGHVAELYYKGELLDQQAYPRRLHAIHADKNRLAPAPDEPPLENETLPSFDDEAYPVEEPLPNINPDNPLLPPLPRK